MTASREASGARLSVYATTSEHPSVIHEQRCLNFLLFLMPFQVLSKSAFGEFLARKLRAGGAQGAPGGLRGRLLETFWLPKRCLFWLFFSSFRGMVFFACIWTVFCSTFFLFEGCSRSARKRRTRRLYRKTPGFKHIFKLCFRAGECRGEQNTHGSGKKTHAKTAPKKTNFLVTFQFFFRSRRPNR